MTSSDLGPPEDARPQTPPPSGDADRDAEPTAMEPAAVDLTPSVEPMPAAIEPTPAVEALPAAPPTPPAAVTPPSAPSLPWYAERPEVVEVVERAALVTGSRRAFLLFTAATLATAAGAWWLLPDRTRARLLPEGARRDLDGLAARVGLTRDRRERLLGRALTFDDDIAEALYSKGRRVRTYGRSDVTPLPNNYAGATPGPEYLATWKLELTGLASGAVKRLGIEDLNGRLGFHEQVTRLVCVEGWSAIAWWGGVRFADVLAAWPPAPGARWAALRSDVNLDGRRNPDPYYVSIDLETARHPQTLLATEQDGRPLGLAHGAPLRLLVPMKLGLKNIKAITHIAYSAEQPRDYWNERGYSKYDGL